MMMMMMMMMMMEADEVTTERLFDWMLCVLQMCITASQMQWTTDVTKALGVTKERGDKKALKSLKKKQVMTWYFCCLPL